jgi:hypothetical protein
MHPLNNKSLERLFEQWKEKLQKIGIVVIYVWFFQKLIHLVYLHEYKQERF